jgi:hypothetical protein
MKLASALVSAACALATAGCSLAVEPGEPPPPVTVAPSGGELTVNWLLVGSSDPGMCSRVGADALEVVLYDPSGRPVTRQTAACETFSITLSLPEGRYSADVTLLDRRGNTRSTPRPLDDVDVIAGTNLAINLDFPPSSLR